MHKYEIQHLPIGNLTLNPQNPRLIKDAAFRHLVKSLADCPSLFDVRPCICSNRTGENIILGGNMRYLAAKELKYKTVPAIVMSGLTEAQEREITIKDNGDFGEWDFEILSNEWSDLPLDDWGIKIPNLSLDGEKPHDMRNNFMSNYGGQSDFSDTGDQQAEIEGEGKYPVTFILDQAEWEKWAAIKERYKLQNDKATFLKIIGGDDHA